MLVLHYVVGSRLRSASLLTLSLGVFIAAATVCHADGPIIRVEEDWELAVGAPNLNSDSPQVTAVMSPFCDVQDIHMSFLLNHESFPKYGAGGLQLQVWNGDSAVDQNASPQKAIMSTEGETVCWTQQMRIEDGKLVFEITSGTSTTWESFGGEGYLKSILGTDLSDLDNYHPEVSTEHTAIDFGSNRVNRLVLKEVRWYDADGLVATDSTPRIVHE